ncbi:MAG: DegV family protein [Acidothermus cellulolyticus]|nr:DegV family protein [Acidothermus cellulolyticus]
MTVAVVTDSTAYFPSDAVVDGIAVIPLTVLADGVAFREPEEMPPSKAVELLRRGVRLTTSRPSPAVFARTYEKLLSGGAEGIVSVHVSGRLSGTVEAAHIAARHVGGDIRVVDSESVGMGMGFAVLAGQAAARSGANLDRVHQVVERVLRATRLYCYVDTLEFLRRGGRLGTVPALVGTALAVKPILAVEDGRLVPIERVRTAARGLTRLADIAAEYADGFPVSVTVHHLDAAFRADRLAADLDARLPHLRELYVAEIGAVVGAHTGPGTVAVAVHRLTDGER